MPPAREAKQQTSLNAQIVNHIPVKNPAVAGNSALSQPPARPAAKMSALDPMFRSPQDPAKQTGNSPKTQSADHNPADANKNVKAAADHVSPPIIAIIIACLVAFGLSAAAVYVYRGGF